jgi:hypothetical protein
MIFRKEHKGKYALVAIYVLFVLLSPVFIFTGSFQDNAKSLVGWIVKEEDDAFFRSYIDQIQSGEIEKSYSQLHPEIQNAFPIEELEKVALFLASSTDTMEVVGANVNSYTDSDGSRTNYEMTYEIANNDSQYKFVLAQINALKENDETLITGFHVVPREGSIKDERKVDFGAQWPFILVAIAIPLLIAFSALHYLSKANNPRWLILIMILFLTLYLTISSEKYGVNFGFNSFASAEGLWGPIVFNTPIPLGALIYWIRRKKLNEAKAEIKAE